MSASPLVRRAAGRSDHRRRRLHRHQSRRSAARARAPRCAIFDNLVAAGRRAQPALAARRHGDARARSRIGDVRDRGASARGGRAASATVFHFAAQVAVTTSLADPRDDFEVNAARHAQRARGGARAETAPPPLVFTSTNKVYGALDDVALVPRRRRATCRPTPSSRCAASARRGRSTSTAPTAARRAPPISTCSTTRARFGLPARRCSA